MSGPDGGNNNNDLVRPEPVSGEILEFVGLLAATADVAAKQITDKLVPICIQQVSVVEKDPAVGGSREYPPYFNELRDRLLIIESALAQINSVIDRAEV